MLQFLRRLFRPRNPVNPNTLAPTVPLSETQLSELVGQDTHSSLPQIVAGGALDIGRRRDNNEDAILSFTGALGADSSGQPFGLYAVADGMGGHRSGEVASETALRALGNHIISRLYQPLYGPHPEPPNESLREIMEDAVRDAHLEVKRAAPGGGCTLTAALVVGNQLVLAHLGDSRAYEILPDGRIKVLTRDHTLVRRLEEMGEITHEEARNHPQKSVLYRALGQSESAEAEVFTASMPRPGALLLCTDGLWGVLEEQNIQRIANSTSNPYLASQQLVDAANAAGGPDNIAALLIRLAG